MQTNINSIFANLMQVRDFVYFLFPDLWISLKWVVHKHFRMLKDVIPSHQRDRPQIFMRVTKLHHRLWLFSKYQWCQYHNIYWIYNFFGEYIYPSVQSLFLMTTGQNAMLFQYLTLRNIFPNLTHIPAPLSPCFLSLSPSSRRPLGVKQIVFWYLTVILPTEWVRL